MLKQKNSLFRKESVERLSSPERLDQLMQVVNPQSWLPLLALSSIVVIAAVWSIKGRIPITVEGQGVLIYPRKVVPLQSRNSGQIVDLNVNVGDVVKKGQILATIDQPELQKQLQQKRNKLTELNLQDKAVNSLQKIRGEQEKISVEQQRQYLQQRISEIQALTPVLKAKGNKSIEMQRQDLQQRIRQAQALTSVYQERMETRKKLFEKERAITSDVALEAEQQYLENLQKISELQAQLKELDVKETEQEKAYRENLTTMADFQAQSKQLNSKQAQEAQQDLENTTARKKEIQELKREIVQLDLQLRNNSQIISQHSGRILEITVTPGQVISEGTRLASINQESSSSKLVGISYFPIGVGKKIQQGMTVQITPQTVKRERFGGIVGTVTNVSQFPITKEGAASAIGNPEIVEGLVSQNQGVIQVFADLEQSSTTPTGYNWSSSTGPNMKISHGTTTVVRVKVEERAPITFVLPILRDFSGIN